MRQPGESEEGTGKHSMVQISEMASQGRSLDAMKPGTCWSCPPKDLWDQPEEQGYGDISEVEIFRFKAGIVDTMESAGRRGDCLIP